jgi:hypothetical protein
LSFLSMKRTIAVEHLPSFSIVFFYLAISNSNYFQVTSEPAPPVHEGAGAVASDSLAAESTRSGGKFATNHNGEPLDVSGSNSTFANTNTSGAHRLDPAADAKSRMTQEDAAEEKHGASGSSYPDSLGGQSKATAVTNTTGSSETGGATSNAGIAPTYVNSQRIKYNGGPHGKNITEGFEGGKPVSGDIGSKNDPGRLAEQRFATVNATADLGTVPKQQGVSGENEYDALERDTSA